MPRAPADLQVGDRLKAVSVYPRAERYWFAAGGDGVMSIAVAQMPGPMGFYLVASITMEEGPDVIIPLHLAEIIHVLNP